MAKTSHYDKEEADLAVNFIESLQHTKGEFHGKPFELIDWQEQLIRDIFGILKPDGNRQFNTVYVEVPKKCGKSELASAISIVMLTIMGEQRGELYSCAATTDQARLVFDVACDMIRLSKTLSKVCEIRPSRKTIIYKPTRSVYRVLSSDAAAASGVNISCLLFDELWVQKDRRFFDMMTKGTSDARSNPLHFIITTAGDNTNSICYEIHQKAMDIIEGRKTDPTFLPVIYGASAEDDWSDPKTWYKANPSLGITISEEKVRIAYESAAQNPAEENAFRQLRLNQWTKQSVRWMPMDVWDKCAFPVDTDSLRGRMCFGGLDLASVSDLTALTLVFPPLDEDDKYIILPFCWLPEDTLEQRVKKDHVNYDVWAKQGLIQTTPGNVVDYRYITNFIEELYKTYNIKQIAFDRWGSQQIIFSIEEMGIEVVPFGQGFKDMGPATKDLMRLTLEQKLAHGGHPVLRWCMDNIFIKRNPAGDEKPDKEHSSEKIDLAVSTIMALSRATVCGLNGNSIYDERGILSI